MRKLVPASAHQLRGLIHASLKASEERRFLHRMHCVLLVAEGCSCYQVARWFGESPRTVERWVHALDAHGMDGLREHRGGGRPARLALDVKRRLADELLHPPPSSGYARPAWNGRLLTQHLEDRYGIRLGPRQCQRMLRRIARGGAA